MNRTLKKFGFWASVFVLVSPAVLVFLWMISLSLKNELDNTAFRRSSSRTADAEELCRCLRAEQFRALSLELDPGHGRGGAARPARRRARRLRHRARQGA
jgi:hypothetical protein